MKPICYVCKQEIRGEAVYVGQGLERHRKCAPLTKRWMENRGANSAISEYYHETTERKEGEE